MQNFCGEFFCKIDSEILKIETTISSPICQAKQLSNFLEGKLNELFSWVENHCFNSVEEEVYFFKELKSKLTSKYIYYHKIIEIESNAPPTNKKLKIKYYKEVINDCHLSSKKDNEFYKYYRCGFTHYDHYYFTRNGTKQSINKHITRVFIDVRRCSLYDYNLAVILANDKLIEYYEEIIEQINNNVNMKSQILQSNLNWTGSKVDLVEVVYALHQSKIINAGNVDVKELAVSFGKMFNIDIEDNIYRFYQDIKARKAVKTKFLNTIAENLNQKIYVRQGPNSQKLTTVEEMRNFFQQTDRIFFDDVSCLEANIENDISKENIKTFRFEAELVNATSDEQLFTNLKLISNDGYLKNGTVLFFGKEPEVFFEKAVIRCLVFDGIDKRYIVDDKIMTGTLYQQYQKSMIWLKSKLNVRYDIEGEGANPRNEYWEIPIIAFKEAIINSLAHRDYYDKGARTTIEVFDDRVEISNPGGLVSAVPRSEFGKRSASRNPLIFSLFERMRLVEQIGSGITRIRDVMNDEGLTPPEFNIDGMFTVTLRRPFDFEKWVEKWVEKLTDNRVKILREVHNNHKVTKKELEQAVSISASGIDNNINFLKDLGLLSREGSDKGGYWKINYLLP